MMCACQYNILKAESDRKNIDNLWLFGPWKCQIQLACIRLGGTRSGLQNNKPWQNIYVLSL